MKSRILIIEDNPANLELMRYLLNAFGHATVETVDGEAGLGRARSDRPDLILCDIALPKLDGYGVAAALKADPASRNIPLIAVSASAMMSDRQRAVDAGFDGFITKPIDPESFVASVETYLRDVTSGDTRT